MNMKGTPIVLAFALAAAVAVADGNTAPAAADAQTSKPLKVLMIGNSFSVCVLRHMPAIAADLGLKLDICSLYIGGCPLSKHAANAAKPETKPYAVAWNYVSVPKGQEPFKSVLGGKSGRNANIPEMLSADAWDIVTIQQASHESWRPETYEPHGTKLLALIAERAPQAKVYVQQTWSYTPFDGRLAKWGINPDTMFERLEAAYDSFAKAHSLPQIRMGKAVQLYRRELPVSYTDHSTGGDPCGNLTFKEVDGKWTHSGDAFHLNTRGDYFQGLVWTATLFGADVTKCKYVPKAFDKHPENAELMRKIAMRVARGED